MAQVKQKASIYFSLPFPLLWSLLQYCYAESQRFQQCPHPPPQPPMEGNVQEQQPQVKSSTRMLPTLDKARNISPGWGRTIQLATVIYSEGHEHAMMIYSVIALFLKKKL